MCPLYLKSIIESAIRDYEELGHDVPPALADELTRMSASTMYRILRPHRIRRAPNKRSGSKASLAAQIPAGPGALEETGEPGILQVDTVALCGGDMRESFFWIVHVTDAATQWTACAPTWNRGAEATTNALAHLLEQLPFPPKVIHVDRNAPEPKAKGHGSEFLNHHLLAFLRTHHPDVRLTRSRPYRKNDNNRIEQKNGSVVRALFGDLRFDDHAQLAPLTALCDQWNLLHDLAIPCRRQVTHHRHVTSRGVTHTRAFDRPQTPWQRLNALRPQPPPPFGAHPNDTSPLRLPSLRYTFHLTYYAAAKTNRPQCNCALVEPRHPVKNIPANPIQSDLCIPTLLPSLARHCIIQAASPSSPASGILVYYIDQRDAEHPCLGCSADQVTFLLREGPWVFPC